MSEGIIVIGGGGHAKVVVSTVSELGVEILAVCDQDPLKQGQYLGNVKIVGPVSDTGISNCRRAVIAIGNNRIRQAIEKKLDSFDWIKAIHPRAYVHPSVTIGEGTVIFAGAAIQPDTVIGRHCIINTNSNIDHDCIIGDYSHIGPGVSLAGNVTVEEGALLGVGAVAIMGVKVGKWSIVGAGAAVVRNIPDNVTAVGVPARILKNPDSI